MDGFNVYFLGLCNFFDSKPGRLVLCPDGRSPEGFMAPHYASLYLQTACIRKNQWWKMKPQNDEMEQIGVGEFPTLEPCRISISGIADRTGCLPFGGGLDTSRHDDYVPKLRVIDPAIRIVPEQAATIVQMPLRHGVLEAFLFGSQSIVTRLQVKKYAEPVTITARADKGNVTRKIVLEPHTDIVFANMSDPAGDHSDEDSHFKLYALLDVNRKSDLLEEPCKLPDVKPLEFTHPYLKFLLEHGTFPPPNCSNTGCCAGELNC